MKIRKGKLLSALLLAFALVLAVPSFSLCSYAASLNLNNVDHVPAVQSPFGIAVSYPASFVGSMKLDSVGYIRFYCEFSLSCDYPGGSNASYWFEDVCFVVNGQTYPCSYFSDASGGRYIGDFEFYTDASDVWVTLMVRVVRTYYKYAPSTTGIDSACLIPSCLVRLNLGTFLAPNISDGKNVTANQIIQNQQTANSLLEQIRDKGGVNSDGGTHDRLDSILSADAAAAQKQQEQMAQQNQLQEQQNQLTTQTNNLLTHFDGKSAMDASNNSLETSIGNYDNVESSIFDTASSSLTKIDFSTSLLPSTGTLGAIMVLGDIVTEIIYSMGEFSSLFTVGFVVVLVMIIFGSVKYIVSHTTGG